MPSHFKTFAVFAVLSCLFRLLFVAEGSRQRGGACRRDPGGRQRRRHRRPGGGGGGGRRGGGGPVPVIDREGADQIRPGHHSGGRHGRAAADRSDPGTDDRSAERDALHGRAGRQEGAAALHDRSAAVPGGAVAGRSGPGARHRDGEQRRAAEGHLRGSLQARPDPARSVRDAARQQRLAAGDARRRSRRGRKREAESRLHAASSAPISGRTGARARPRRRPDSRQRHDAAGRDQPGLADLRVVRGPGPLSRRHPPLSGEEAARSSRRAARRRRAGRAGAGAAGAPEPGRSRWRPGRARRRRSRQGRRRDRPRHLHRQHRRPDDRHDQAEGHVPERRSGPVARAVRAGAR